MKNNPTALNLLGSYKSNATASEIFGYPGGFLIGWPNLKYKL
jgi:hypothetical protein